MTTHENKRFTAAVAALQGLLANRSAIHSDSNVMAVAAKNYADALLAKLDETEPRACEHKNKKIRFVEDWPPYGGGGYRSEGHICDDCGEVLP